MSETFHIHLISDATGETLHAVAKAAVAQFENVPVQEHFHTLVRSHHQLERTVEAVREHPGAVFFTVVDPGLRDELVAQCASASVPWLDVMEGPVRLLQRYFGVKETHKPGAQHELGQEYLQRIEALNYAIQYDDGQAIDKLGEAEVILVGASRTGKTPISVYLAMRGVKAANVPLVLNIPTPPALLDYQKPLIVGLWATPERLVQIRRTRLATMGEERPTSYVDLNTVRDEVMETRRLYERQGWPSIDVTRRSVEETAATVLNLLAERSGRHG